jgi:hypothetical protein
VAFRRADLAIVSGDVDELGASRTRSVQHRYLRDPLDAAHRSGALATASARTSRYFLAACRKSGRPDVKMTRRDWRSGSPPRTCSFALADASLLMTASGAR